MGFECFFQFVVVLYSMKTVLEIFNSKISFYKSE